MRPAVRGMSTTGILQKKLRKLSPILRSRLGLQAMARWMRNWQSCSLRLMRCILLIAASFSLLMYWVNAIQLWPFAVSNCDYQSQLVMLISQLCCKQGFAGSHWILSQLTHSYPLSRLKVNFDCVLSILLDTFMQLEQAKQEFVPPPRMLPPGKLIFLQRKPGPWVLAPSTDTSSISSRFWVWKVWSSLNVGDIPWMIATLAMLME